MRFLTLFMDLLVRLLWIRFVNLAVGQDVLSNAMSGTVLVHWELSRIKLVRVVATCVLFFQTNVRNFSWWLASLILVLIIRSLKMIILRRLKKLTASLKSNFDIIVVSISVHSLHLSVIDLNLFLCIIIRHHLVVDDSERFLVILHVLLFLHGLWCCFNNFIIWLEQVLAAAAPEADDNEQTDEETEGYPEEEIPVWFGTYWTLLVSVFNWVWRCVYDNRLFIILVGDCVVLGLCFNICCWLLLLFLFQFHRRLGLRLFIHLFELPNIDPSSLDRLISIGALQAYSWVVTQHSWRIGSDLVW